MAKKGNVAPSETNSPKRRLDAFLRTSAAPLLRDAGFTRRGHTWRRVRDDAIEVLAIHADRWNHGARCRFACVAALWYPAVARRLRQRAVRSPSWWQCHVRYHESGQDHQLDPGDDGTKLTRTVRAELHRLLRWLEPRTSLNRAWRALPKPPQCPPATRVVDTLRVLGGQQPLAKKHRSSRPPKPTGRFEVLDVRPG